MLQAHAHVFLPPSLTLPHTHTLSLSHLDVPLYVDFCSRCSSANLQYGSTHPPLPPHQTGRDWPGRKPEKISFELFHQILIKVLRRIRDSYCIRIQRGRDVDGGDRATLSDRRGEHLPPTY